MCLKQVRFSPPSHLDLRQWYWTSISLVSPGLPFQLPLLKWRSFSLPLNYYCPNPLFEGPGIPRYSIGKHESQIYAAKEILPQNFSSEELRGSEQCANTFVNKKSNKLFSWAGETKGWVQGTVPRRGCACLMKQNLNFSDYQTSVIIIVSAVASLCLSWGAGSFGEAPAFSSCLPQLVLIGNMRMQSRMQQKQP